MHSRERRRGGRKRSHCYHIHMEFIVTILRFLETRNTVEHEALCQLWRSMVFVCYHCMVFNDEWKKYCFAQENHIIMCNLFLWIMGLWKWFKVPIHNSIKCTDKTLLQPRDPCHVQFVRRKCGFCKNYDWAWSWEGTNMQFTQLNNGDIVSPKIFMSCEIVVLVIVHFVEIVVEPSFQIVSYHHMVRTVRSNEATIHCIILGIPIMYIFVFIFYFLKINFKTARGCGSYPCSFCILDFKEKWRFWLAHIKAPFWRTPLKIPLFECSR